jgi:amidophosphoribosyltransferase
VEKLIGADWLIYQSLDDLIACVAEENPDLRSFESSIFNGEYVTGDVDQPYLSQLEEARKNS